MRENRDRDKNNRKRIINLLSGAATIGIFIYLNAPAIGDLNTPAGWMIFFAIVVLTGWFLWRRRMRAGDGSEQKTGGIYKRRPQEPENAQGRASPADIFSPDDYDRQRRLKQLDGFLKNGLIGKEEYRMMRARYEKTGMPNGSGQDERARSG